MAKIEKIPQSQLPLLDLSKLTHTPYRNIEPILRGNFEMEATPGGSRSIGFRIALSDENPSYYLKVYYKTPIPRSDLLGLISRAKNNYQFPIDQFELLKEEVSGTEIFHMLLMRQVEQQAAAHVVGNRIRPDLVVPLHAIWVYHTTPVGFTTEYIEGKPITMRRALELGGETMQKALQELQENGVTIDRGLNHYNAIKTPSRKIKLIDLDYELKRI